MLLKPKIFEKLKIQNNIPDLQHQLKFYSKVIFGNVSIIKDVKTKGMTMTNFTGHKKQPFVNFLKKCPWIICVRKCLEI